MDELNNTLYLKKIASIGDRETILAAQDIYSVTGIKLIGEGNQVNTDLYQKILSHKLAKPIDESLTIDNCITPDTLLDMIFNLADENFLCKEIISNDTRKQFVTRIVKSIKIPKPLQFRLSILNLSMKETVHHCLLVTITSIYIAQKLNLDTKKIVNLAYAAIFLDIGLLHLDMEIFSKSNRLSNDERKQIYSHPIIAALIIKSYVNDREICLSIMDHHERADGSGYPKGKRLEEISQNGQILGIAELAVTLSQNPGKYSYKTRVQSILKFNSEQYEKNVLQILLELISTIDSSDYSFNSRNTDREVTRTDFIDLLLKIWSAINNYNEGNSENNIVSDFIYNQLNNLKYNLNMSGLSMEVFTMGNEDIDEILNESEEIHALVDEAYYKLESIIKEIKRRWFGKIPSSKSFANEVEWLNQMDNILT